MAPIVIDFFPKQSVLYDGLNISLEVDETLVIVNIRAESELTFKDWRKFVELFIYKKYVVCK